MKHLGRLSIIVALAWDVAAAEVSLSVGDERIIAGEGPGKNIRGTPAIAFGGGAYLCVWREGREGKNGGARIRATRVSPDGAAGAAIEVAPLNDKDSPQESPRVAFCNGTFLVVWHDLRNRLDYDILAARLSADGKRLDDTPIKVAVGPHNQALPDVAADDAGFLVVWQAYDPQDHAFHGRGVRVERDGKVGSLVDIGASPNPRIVWDGRQFFVGTGGFGSMGTGHIVRIDPAGMPLSKARPVAVTTRVGNFSLSAVPGKGCVYVTHRSTPDAWGWGGPGAMRCYFILADGTSDTSMPKEEGYPKYTLQPNWLDAATQDRANWPHGPSASAWDGRQTIVVWSRFHCTGEKRSTLSNGDIMASRTNGWKRQSDTAIAVAASEQDELNPELASDGRGGLLCVYEKETGAMSLICARPIFSK